MSDYSNFFNFSCDGNLTLTKSLGVPNFHVHKHSQDVKLVIALAQGELHLWCSEQHWNILNPVPASVNHTLSIMCMIKRG